MSDRCHSSRYGRTRPVRRFRERIEFTVGVVVRLLDEIVLGTGKTVVYREIEIGLVTG
ncbi:hypothetical protein SAMN04487967_2635 [Natronorubrum sediminis]|uniref:Uncharacterized protein n=1 Tax=Natronorubrum sediminis TaxID=640943 RepID=A0A1H6G2D3_9EURY|nr:hypothetical protein SAMN04487967_2635 [Natronorubrum sediminis]